MRVLSCRRKSRYTQSMQSSAPPTIFAERRRAAVAGRAATRADPARYLLDEIADDCVERVGFMQLQPARVLVLCDIAGVLYDALRTALPDAHCTAPGPLREDKPLDLDPFDLVVAGPAFATVNDLPGALINLHTSLNQGGVFLASFPGAGSLAKLRRILLDAEPDRPTARMHPLIDRSASAALLQRAGFTRQVVDSHSMTVRYGALATLVADLRDQGLQSVLADAPPPLTRTTWRAAQSVFQALADDDGKLTERFELLTLTGWR